MFFKLSSELSSLVWFDYHFLEAFSRFASPFISPIHHMKLQSNYTYLRLFKVGVLQLDNYYYYYYYEAHSRIALQGVRLTRISFGQVPSFMFIGVMFFGHILTDFEHIDSVKITSLIIIIIIKRRIQLTQCSIFFLLTALKKVFSKNLLNFSVFSA